MASCFVKHEYTILLRFHTWNVRVTLIMVEKEKVCLCRLSEPEIQSVAT